MRVLKISEWPNTLLLVASIANRFIGDDISGSPSLSSWYCIAYLSPDYLIIRLASFQSALTSSYSAVHLAKELPAQRYFLSDPS